MKSRPCVTAPGTSSNSELQVFEGKDDVGAKLSGGDTSNLAAARVPKGGVKRCAYKCVACGCYLGGCGNVDKCKRCCNHSFEHILD